MNHELEHLKQSLQQPLTPVGQARVAVLDYMVFDQLVPGEQLNLPGLFHVAIRLTDEIRKEVTTAIEQFQTEGVLDDDLILMRDILDVY